MKKYINHSFILFCWMPMIFAKFKRAKPKSYIIIYVLEYGLLFQRWLVLKIKTFGKGSTFSKKNEIKNSVDKSKLQFDKKCQNCTFKVNFCCEKSMEFLLFFSLVNMNLGECLLKTFFLVSTLILKSCPIFDELTFIYRFFFHLSTYVC